MTTSQLVSAKTIAARLGVSPVTLRVWRQRGKGPPYVVVAAGARNRVRYDTKAVEAWVTAQTVAPQGLGA